MEVILEEKDGVKKVTFRPSAEEEREIRARLAREHAERDRAKKAAWLDARRAAEQAAG